VAAADALARLTREPVPESVISAYGGKSFKFGPEYLIPKPFDPRVLWWVAPAVAKAAIDSKVARRTIDIEAYGERLARRSGNAGYSIMRGMVRAAKRDPKRIVFPDAADPKLLRAVQTIMDEGIARPILLGRPGAIEEICRDNDFDILEQGAEVIDPWQSDKHGDYAEALWKLRQRKGMTRGLAQSLVSKANYFGTMMVQSGDADGLVSGLRLTFPETVRPALQILGLCPGVKVATSMYMMLLKDRVKFFSDATINIDPDAETLADIAVQVTDAVAAMGITPRAAMISFANFGSVQHPEISKVKRALDLVREARPDLEIDGEMQIDYALDRAKLEKQFPFSHLTQPANVLIFPTLSACNVAFRVLKTMGGAQAVGPILLGLARPVALLQNESTEEDIVNMTAHTVLTAQRQQSV
jgi:malate dehydrogenase (oxaloacetate-decarboxylating)(NADP+)